MCTISISTISTSITFTTNSRVGTISDSSFSTGVNTNISEKGGEKLINLKFW